MATVSDLRTGLVDTFEAALPGWNVYRFPPDTISAPAIALLGPAVDAGTFGDAANRVQFDMVVCVSHRHVDQMELLDEVLSPNGDPSLWRILDNDPDLGGNVAFCVVQSVGEYGQRVIGDVPYYGASVQLSAML
jgi:hypothetical protein